MMKLISQTLYAHYILYQRFYYRSIDKGKPLDDFKHEELLLKTKRVFRVFVFTDFDN
jgi:hypothetical protein